MSTASAASLQPLPLPTLRDAMERPLETLSLLLGKRTTELLQRDVAVLLSDRRTVERVPDRSSRGASDQDDRFATSAPISRSPRTRARNYHRTRALRGRHASDRGYEQRTARRVIPADGLRRVRGRADWWDTFEQSAYFAGLDETQTHPATGMTKKALIQQLVRSLGATTRGASGVTSPGHAYLSTKLGVSRRTVTRYLRELERAGFLQALSAGRSAGRAGPGSRPLRVVYLPTAPNCPGGNASSPHRVVPTITGQFSQVVEKPVTPSVATQSSRSHVRAREPRELAGEWLRGPETTPTGLFGRAPTTARCDFVPTLRLGPRAICRHHRLELATQLLQRAPDLRSMTGLTDRAIAAAIRDFVNAGYTIDDLAQMLDWTGDGERRPHGGLHGIEHPINWIAQAFKTWRDSSGNPLPSTSAKRKQRATDRAQAAERRARQQAVDDARRAEVAAGAHLLEPGYRRFVEVKAQLSQHHATMRSTLGFGASHPGPRTKEATEWLGSS